MGRVRHLEGDGDEAVEVHGRTDHCENMKQVRRRGMSAASTGSAARRSTNERPSMVAWTYQKLDAQDPGRRECEAEEAVGRGDAGQRHAEGPQFKKMVTRRKAAGYGSPLFDF